MLSLTIAGLQGITPKLMEDGSNMQKGISEDLPH
jgi:hypothetical protein